ncbi:hypothetical protein EV189_3088 [Motilibacter rhizosphaerae]|uniref:SCO6045-like C-terminal domain-containing protein n=1 Tax=Motilibacter rhizosphaerae TaxID=598652 RepID=A0A4V2F3D1_9ACTN|nr:hypothetical protein [Motilibacter rhizosphaerae]RZS82693.1 hypothetical protein EV189_3088 [Motilibacter rhizosphaerae]
MSSPAARAALAEAQAELMAALVAGGPPPDGFDARQVRAQADALVGKRRMVVAALRPDLVRACGDGFARAFAEYAATRPRPPEGALADADAFAAALGLRAAGRRRRWRR